MEKQLTKHNSKDSKQSTAILYTRTASMILGEEIPTLQHQQQEKELRTYCKKNNIEVIKVIYDMGSGITFEDRLEFNTVLQQLKDGEIKADYFLYTSIDRLSRNIGNMLDVQRRIQNLGIEPLQIKQEDSKRFMLPLIEQKRKRTGMK